MDYYKTWQRALEKTEVIRPRIAPLSVTDTTDMPYICLAESAVNPGTTVVRKGKVMVEKPALLLPPNIPQFEGFELEDGRAAIDYLLIRGIRFPSVKYDNRVYRLDVYDGSLSQAHKYYHDLLQREEDVKTSLVLGPEDCWQFSVIIFVGLSASRSAQSDLKKILDAYHNGNMDFL